MEKEWKTSDKFKQLCKQCHVRSSIYRESKPEIKYPKNHSIPFINRIPHEDQLATDWKEYDPYDHETTSLTA